MLRTNVMHGIKRAIGLAAFMASACYSADALGAAGRNTRPNSANLARR
jgi:hypothetical protein